MFFIDTYVEGHFETGKSQNILRNSEIEENVKTYEARTDVEKYAHVAALAEIRENDYNLNLSRYVDTFEEDPLVDIEEVERNIASIEKELADVQAQMKKYMEELGL